MIDADEAKSFAKECWPSDTIRLPIDAFLNICPTVDAEPVRHGYWVYDKNGMDWNLGAWECSECGERNNNLGGTRRINPYNFVGSRYCPNCGARMDVKEDDHAE